MRKLDSIWTDERNRRLLELREEGLSGSQISDRLTKEAGFTITRNSVIGRLTRINEKLSRKKAEVKNRVVRLPKTAHSNKAMLPMKSTLHGAKAVLGLRKHQCRWPIGETIDKDFQFCDNNVEDGKSYCTSHMRIAYVPIQRSIRK